MRIKQINAQNQGLLSVEKQAPRLKLLSRKCAEVLAGDGAHRHRLERQKHPYSPESGGEPKKGDGAHPIYRRHFRL
jgi:hypothetical protein